MMKLNKDRYVEYEGCIGLDNRFWLKIVKKHKLFCKAKYQIEMISNRDKFNTEEEAIEYAKHILWCLSVLINRKPAVGKGV